VATACLPEDWKRTTRHRRSATLRAAVDNLASSAAVSHRVKQLLWLVTW